MRGAESRDELGMTGGGSESWVLPLLSAAYVRSASQVQMCSQGWFVKANQHTFCSKYGYWSEIYVLRGNTGLNSPFKYVKKCWIALEKG